MKSQEDDGFRYGFPRYSEEEALEEVVEIKERVPIPGAYSWAEKQLLVEKRNKLLEEGKAMEVIRLSVLSDNFGDDILITIYDRLEEMIDAADERGDEAESERLREEYEKVANWRWEN